MVLCFVQLLSGLRFRSASVPCPPLRRTRDRFVTGRGQVHCRVRSANQRRVSRFDGQNHPGTGRRAQHRFSVPAKWKQLTRKAVSAVVTSSDRLQQRCSFSFPALSFSRKFHQFVMVTSWNRQCDESFNLCDTRVLWFAANFLPLYSQMTSLSSLQSLTQ